MDIKYGTLEVVKKIYINFSQQCVTQKSYKVTHETTFKPSASMSEPNSPVQMLSLDIQNRVHENLLNITDIYKTNKTNKYAKIGNS